MPSENGTAKAIIFDIHEERIQRLEDARVENASQVAEQTAALKDIKEELLEVKDAIKAGNSAITLVVQKLEEHVSSNEDRVSKLENSQDIKLKKMDFRHKLIYALWVGAGGSLALLIEKFLGH